MWHIPQSSNHRPSDRFYVRHCLLCVCGHICEYCLCSTCFLACLNFTLINMPSSPSSMSFCFRNSGTFIFKMYLARRRWSGPKILVLLEEGRCTVTGRQTNSVIVILHCEFAILKSFAALINLTIISHCCYKIRHETVIQFFFLHRRSAWRFFFCTSP